MSRHERADGRPVSCRAAGAVAETMGEPASLTGLKAKGGGVAVAFGPAQPAHHAAAPRAALRSLHVPGRGQGLPSLRASVLSQPELFNSQKLYCEKNRKGHKTFRFGTTPRSSQVGFSFSPNSPLPPFLPFLPFVPYGRLRAPRRVERSAGPLATRHPPCLAWSLEVPPPRSVTRGASQPLSLSREAGAVQVSQASVLLW